MSNEEANLAPARYGPHRQSLRWILCLTHHSSDPEPHLAEESNNIQDVGFGAREKAEMNEMTTLLKEMVVLLRDINQRQALLGV
jgi:hypothetical protein